MKRLLEYCKDFAVKTIIAILLLIAAIFFVAAVFCGLAVAIIVGLPLYLFSEIKDALTK